MDFAPDNPTDILQIFGCVLCSWMSAFHEAAELVHHRKAITEWR
jgi:hypothetical protein